MCAVLTGKLFAADPHAAQRQGGLHVNVVVDARDGRCGMAIPAAAASNASIWAARIWVPLPMLRVAAAAAGMLPASCGGCGLGSNSSSITSSSSGSGNMGCTCSVGVGGGACPELMSHIALELQRQMSDAAGAVNKQFEWWEAARRAGRCGQLHLCQGLPHTDAGDITFDCLRGSAWELAALPGCRLVAASLRWPCAYFNRVVMASRAPPQQQASGQPGAVAGLDGPSGGGCTGEADIQIELNMPRRGAKQLWQAWHRMGLQHICMLGATPHQQQPATCSACPPASSSGNYKAACICSWCSAPCRAGDGVWQVVEGLMCPGALRLSLHDALGYLPWLLLRWCQQLCFALLHITYYVANHLPRNSLVSEQLHPLSLSLDGGATKVGHADFVSALMAMTPGEANVLAGMVMQANSFGSSYAFGKSLTELMVADTPRKQGAFKAIVRPALISNLAGSPYPGYLQGYAGPGGYIMAYAMGFCQGLGSMAYGSDQVLDLIPCDTVAALVICAAAAAAADTAADTAQAAAAGTSGATTVYHASSSASHPLPIADAFSYMAEY
uniref:Fatty acyl-CoA reductase n=1 Tax=Tetradesmus obliquus TaxID=3088 RepID=A0A383WIR0_TETOB|eukprot:jgi/Sobl393_1/6241/SZX76994.1